MSTPVYAHGEASQQSWARTTTASFFDTHFSGDLVNLPARGGYLVDVGKHLTLSGKIQISDKWPVVLGGFSLGHLGVNMPGPAFIIIDKRINGSFVPGSTVMRPGDYLDYTMDLVARRPGRWHLHPRLDLKGKGPLVGPGQWVTVRDAGGTLRNEVTLGSGERIDLERYGLSTVLGWHALWFALGLAVSVFWLRRATLTRLSAVRADYDIVVPLKEKKFPMAAGGLALLLIVAGFVYSGHHWNTIPLQVRHDHVPVLRRPQLADATLEQATFDRNKGVLTMVVNVQNKASDPVTIESFVTGPLTLAAQPWVNLREVQVNGNPGSLNADSENVGQVPIAGSVYVDPDVPLGVGQRQQINLVVNGSLIHKNRLTFTNSAVNQFGGLLIVRDANGQRSWVSMVADLNFI